MTCSKDFTAFASVIPELSIGKPLDYGIPKEMLEQIKPGVKVEVPIRGYLRRAYVFEVKEKSKFSRVLPIAAVSSSMELITKDLFELALWMSQYYMTPLNAVFKVLLPASVRKDTKAKQQLFVMRNKTREELKEAAISLRGSKQADVLDEMLQVTKGILLTELLEKAGCTKSPVDTLCKKGLLMVENVRIDRSPLIGAEYLQTAPKKLGPEQQEALNKIVEDLDGGIFSTHLLFGVTGSGKTEVYLQAIDRTLKLGKNVIMLVPEISLTQQTIERFKSRFQETIAILHHRLSHGERFDEWEKIRKGEARIVIGARSAIFSPIQNLGLIIVDEEHESSYKQSEEMPTYNGRDVAVMRGKLTKSTVILGSATPSLESYYNATQGKYHLSVLRCRPDQARIPDVHVVDMKKEFERAGGYTTFSDALLGGIKQRFKKGEQTILFLNRRGYHTMLFCEKCRKGVQCPHCDANLTFHHGDKALSCHLCGYNLSPPPRVCPGCKAPSPMKFRGVGTEQVERALHAVFPEIRTIRLDADTTRHKGSHQKLLRDFATGKADVMIGTQMIAKGLHFSEVTLVGVLNSDSSLNIPDFRSSENVFQLITQVAGRSGRGALAGEVIIQTHMPENGTIKHASKQDFEGFYEDEIAVRKYFGFPPFTRMVKLTFSGKGEAVVLRSANSFREKLVLPEGFSVHPVVPAGYAKVKDSFRFQFLIRGPSLTPIARAIEKAPPSPSQVKLLVDVNPLSTY